MSQKRHPTVLGNLQISGLIPGNKIFPPAIYLQRPLLIMLTIVPVGKEKLFKGPIFTKQPKRMILELRVNKLTNVKLGEWSQAFLYTYRCDSEEREI